LPFYPIIMQRRKSMSKLKTLTAVVLASTLASLVTVAPIAAQASAEVKAEGAPGDRVVVSEPSTIPFEFSHNLGGSPGELY
jgi:hypothetical protein